MPYQEFKPKLDFIGQEMSRHRLMSSRVLGEDTVRVRENLTIGDMDGDIVGILKGSICLDNKEMLNRSATGVASSSLSSNSILDHILAEGVTCLTIKPMGGMLHLIVFDTIEDKESMIESKWLQQWFMELRNVNNSCASLWREAWINIFGVPIAAWSYDNYFKIGCIFGRVLSVEYTNFDCARILVLTDCLFKINNKMFFDIEDKRHRVFCSEDAKLCIHPNPAQRH